MKLKSFYLSLLSLVFLIGCSSEPGKDGLEGHARDGETLSIFDSSKPFGEHELDIEFGGGKIGWIEANDSGTTFANPDNLNEGNPNFVGSKYMANGKGAGVPGDVSGPGVGYSFPYYEGEGYALPRILTAGEESHSGATLEDAYSGNNAIDCSVDRTKSRNGNSAFGALKYPEGYRKAFVSFMYKARVRGIHREEDLPWQWKMMSFSPGYHSAYGSSLYIYRQTEAMSGGGSRCCDGKDNCPYGLAKSAACNACMMNDPDAGLSGDPMECTVGYQPTYVWDTFEPDKIPWPAEDVENDGIVDENEYEWARLWFYFDMGTYQTGNDPDGQTQHYAQKKGEPPYRVTKATRLRHRYACGKSSECPDGDNQINYKAWLMNFFQFHSLPNRMDYLDLYFDDFYVAFGDDAYKRVEVGNCADYYSCTKLDLQRVLDWNPGQIDIELNLPRYGADEDLFVHVILDHDTILTYPITEEAE